VPARKRPPRGRRPGTSGTREAIAEAARQSFAETGYDRAGIRAVAERAGVDPALVMHYFGSKQELFVSVMALPYVPEDVLPALVSREPREESGQRLARFVVDTLETPQGQAILTGMVRAAAAEPAIANLVREQVSERIVAGIASGLGGEDAHRRASLAASQIIGLIMARYVIGITPLAAMAPDALVAALAPTFQHYLTGPLS
jgi:AcrR family transcriptional regulator